MHKIPRVVVIDDDKETVEVFCEYLRIIDVDVVGQGYNGKDAVALYAEHRPDIVFVDLVMPEYDGLFALENIKKLDPNAKVVVITSNYREECIREILKLGPHKILQKPFETEVVLDIIDQIRKMPIAV